MLPLLAWVRFFRSRLTYLLSLLTDLLKWNRFLSSAKWWTLQNFKACFKGYIHYKTITSQNVSSEGQIKNFFILEKNYVLFSRYPSFCIFNKYLMIYKICDVTMSIGIWDKVQFWIYLLNHNLWSHQTWRTDRYKQGH